MQRKADEEGAFEALLVAIEQTERQSPGEQKQNQEAPAVTPPFVPATVLRFLHPQTTPRRFIPRIIVHSDPMQKTVLRAKSFFCLQCNRQHIVTTCPRHGSQVVLQQKNRKLAPE